eukprot:SM000030S11387  [mRNA]  locus=s30:484723:486287:- [translate_table: standard]
MAAVSTFSPASVAALPTGTVAARPRSAAAARPLALRNGFVGSRLAVAGSTPKAQQYAPLSVRARYNPDSTTTDASAQTQKFVEDVKLRWEQTENKGAVIAYASGAFVALWFSSTIVGAVNSVPLLPKLLELVGLGYTGWFVYRYLLFKSSRKELLEEIEVIKGKITGAQQDVESDFKDIKTKVTGSSKPIESDIQDVKEKASSGSFFN